MISLRVSATNLANTNRIENLDLPRFWAWEDFRKQANTSNYFYTVLAAVFLFILLD